MKLPQEPYSSYENEEAVVTGFGDDYVFKVLDKKTKKPVDYIGVSSYRMKYASVTVVPSIGCTRSVGRVHPNILYAKVEQSDPEKPEGVCTVSPFMIYQISNVVKPLNVATGQLENFHSTLSSVKLQSSSLYPAKIDLLQTFFI